MDANPVEFVSRNLQHKHLLLLHEDQTYAKLVEFAYLLAGLRRTRPCFYLTYQDRSDARRLMKKRGLDVERFEKKGLLHVLRIRSEIKDFWGTLEKTVSSGGEEAKSFRHARIVWLFNMKRYDERKLLSHVEQDSAVQATLKESGTSAFTHPRIYRGFLGSILCSYPAHSLGNPRILKSHIDNHDGIILAPRHGEGAVLLSNGLKKADIEAWMNAKLET